MRVTDNEGGAPIHRIKVNNIRTGLARSVDRATLLASCAFDVWLPTVPADLVQVWYSIMDYDDGSTSSSSVVFQATSRDRHVRVDGMVLFEYEGRPMTRESARKRSEDRHLTQAVLKGETFVSVHSQGLTEDEFDDVVRSLEKATE